MHVTLTGDFRSTYIIALTQAVRLGAMPPGVGRRAANHSIMMLVLQTGAMLISATPLNTLQ